MNPSSNKKWIPASAGMTNIPSALCWSFPCKRESIDSKNRTLYAKQKKSLGACSPIIVFGDTVRRNDLVRISLFVFFLFIFSSRPLPASELPHHNLSVTLDPQKQSLTATDTVTLPRDFPREFTFALHSGLNPSSPDSAVRIVRKGARPGAVPLEVFTVTLPKDATAFSVRYGGAIFHPVQSDSRYQARGIDQTAGSIGEEGVYLAGSSAWYPLLGVDFLTFTLTVQLPGEWDALSQGSRTIHQKTKSAARAGWDSPEPQEEIYLIASRFAVYEKTEGKFTAMVYLRKPEEALANKYLDATIRYVGMYDRLIGPYPYGKFALVENFWETGFGMPSFTLLGPTVLRLPFIINTSYPHEILHNWWGNSVYPVYEKGNWSEGLTAYLADHLLKEQQGAGAEYRMNTLQKYADYVSSGRDFPLTAFTSRHSPSTEAVGYGKALMFFHMLRLDLGDRKFSAAIRDFYRNYLFHYAAFADIEKSFEATTGKSLDAEFRQWVTRTGAPEIRLRDTQTEERGGNYLLNIVMEQVQQGEPYKLRVPVAVTLEGQDKAFQTVVDLNGRKQNVSISVPARPLRLDIDPEFDVFRRLGRDEIPPAISQALGAKKMLVVLPGSAAPDLLDEYKAFAESLSRSGPDDVDVKLDRNLEKLPGDRSVTVLGWENRFRDQALAACSDYEVKALNGKIRIGNEEIERANHSVVLTARNPGNKDTALMFIAADRRQSLPGLGRKLPHYHKYSYLAFEGEEPTNVAKGRWPVVNSPLTAFLAADTGTGPRVEMGKLASREALAAAAPMFSEERMIETVKYLSGKKFKGRAIATPEIDLAAVYVAEQFKKAGLKPGGDNGTYFQTWKDQAGRIMKNVIGVIPGKKPRYAGQSVVVGAHYDHLGLGLSLGRTGDKGKIHPGADDNASGIAALLESARVLNSSFSPDRSIVFIAFTGEEEGKLGSSHYVKHEKTYPASKCIGMLNLDTVGRLGKRKLLILGSGSAREWVHIFRGAGFVTGVETEMVAEDLDSSDHKSFQAAGVPAVQLFSGPHADYHRPTDTADKIDSSGLVKVASVTKEVVEYLANREEPLTSTIKPGSVTAAGPGTGRKTSLGTIPDFSYSGRGVRLSGVMDGSPAASAGLKEGDIITGINGSAVGSLREFSDILKRLKPGDKVSLVVVRDGGERTVETRVKER